MLRYYPSVALTQDPCFAGFVEVECSSADTQVHTCSDTRYSAFSLIQRMGERRNRRRPRFHICFLENCAHTRSQVDLSSQKHSFFTSSWDYACRFPTLIKEPSSDRFNSHVSPWRLGEADLTHTWQNLGQHSLLIAVAKLSFGSHQKQARKTPRTQPPFSHCHRDIVGTYCF